MPQYNPYQDALDGMKRLGQGFIKSNPGTALDQPVDDSIQTKNWGTGHLSQAPSFETYRINRNLEDEQRDRLFAAQRTGDSNEAAALQGLLKNTQGDIEESPVTQNWKAQQQGFDTPAAAAQWGRGLEEAKVNSPAKVAGIAAQAGQNEANITGAANLMGHRMQGQSAEAVANINQNAANERIKGQQDIMNSILQGGGGQNLRSVSPTGGFTLGPEPKVDTSGYKALATAVGLAGKGGAGTQDRVDQTRQDLFINDQAPPELKEVAEQIAADPEDSKEPFESIAARVGGLTPQDKVHLRRLLALKRGRDF